MLQVFYLFILQLIFQKIKYDTKTSLWYSKKTVHEFVKTFVTTVSKLGTQFGRILLINTEILC